MLPISFGLIVTATLINANPQTIADEGTTQPRRQHLPYVGNFRGALPPTAGREANPVNRPQHAASTSARNDNYLHLDNQRLVPTGTYEGQQIVRADAGAGGMNKRVKIDEGG